MITLNIDIIYVYEFDLHNYQIFVFVVDEIVFWIKFPKNYCNPYYKHLILKNYDIYNVILILI